MKHPDFLLGTAALLAIAAYILLEDDASADTMNSSATPQAASGDLGFVNNNPGNIKYSSANNWEGQTGQNQGFCVFSSAQYGVRALGIVCNTKYTEGYTTITSLITSYEGGDAANNDIPAYIAAVSASMQLDANTPMSWPADQLDLVMSIILHENGSNPYDIADVQQWIATP